MSCRYCGQPCIKPYRGVAHTECYKQHKRLEWQQASPTNKQRIADDMKLITLIEQTFTEGGTIT